MTLTKELMDKIINKINNREIEWSEMLEEIERMNRVSNKFDHQQSPPEGS